ncbi:hypothetical protein GCM10011579_023980 [Streptomyces albiflavescens]|uniref:Uncharacterized protein n=1 Tax=Streptomyces albiflavescens TaxID=1623582 RepID=A0A918D2J9_9ACTN|nr:hypothetical protein GCM10011579_023980 [Streptomyces albiflavescens]
MLSRGALCAAAGARKAAIRAAVAAVASDLQVVKRMRRAGIGMRGTYPGQLVCKRGPVTVRKARGAQGPRSDVKGPCGAIAHVGRMAIV